MVARQQYLPQNELWRLHFYYIFKFYFSIINIFNLIQVIFNLIPQTGTKFQEKNYGI